MSNHSPHIPVMVAEVMEFLLPEQGGPYWDLTLGAGGHMAEFLARAPVDTSAFGLDGDPSALDRARARITVPVALCHGDLGALAELVTREGWPNPQAVLLDLGLSSPQVDDPSRGFSYRHDGPLDMRMDPTHGPTASEWLNGVGRKELEQVLRELGEERFAGRIARVIKERLPILTTTALADAVLDAVGRRPRRHHPARRTFQAIRIAVNQELERMEAGLQQAIDHLVVGGRVAVISFHSGEDRVVKHTFKARARAGELRVLTRKPIPCSNAEGRENPRARSAKLRAAERI